MTSETLHRFVALATISFVPACSQAPEPPDVDAVERVADLDVGLEAVHDDVDPEACRRIDDRARELLTATMQCSSDIQCDTWQTVDLVGETCLPALACYVPVAEGTPLRPVIAQLRELDRLYQEECGMCPIPLCIDPDRMFSTCEQTSCELNAAPESLHALTIRPPDHVPARVAGGPPTPAR